MAERGQSPTVPTPTSYSSSTYRPSFFSYVSARGLSNLKTYKYSGSDKSIIANYVLKPFWEASVNLLPETMAPNLVTLVGFGFIIASYLLMLLYATDLLGYNVPGFVWITIGIFQFIYQTMDAIDGKQARRTKSSSPLGELCDHGCDSLSSSLMALQLMTALNVGTTWVAFYIFFMGLLPFYSGQWEEYHTGTLDLGYFNVTESELMMIFIHILTGVTGSVWWDTKVTIPVIGLQLSYSALLLISSTFAVFYTFGSNVIAMKNKIVQRNQSEKLNAVEVFGRLSPYFELTVLFLVWALVSPTDVYSNHPHLFFLSFGLLFSNLIGRMVLCRVCNESFNPDRLVLAPAALAVINALILRGAIPEILIVYGLFFYSLSAFLVFANWVVRSITSELGINFITISKKQQ